MRVDYILSLVESIELFFSEYFDVSLVRESLDFLKETKEVSSGVYIALKGSIEGKIVVEFSKSFEQFIINKMTEEFDDELDEEMYYSALKEIVNQMAASIINRVDEEGCDWDIGVPHVIINGKPKIQNLKLETLVIPYDNIMGKLEINVAVKELKN